jgi:SSS family solute:Na+ symporter
MLEQDAVLAEWTGGPKDQVGLLAIVLGSTVAWVVATLATRPTGDDKLDAFFARVRPGGFWGPVAARSAVRAESLGRDLRMWVASTVLVFGALFGLGSMLLLDTAVGMSCIAVALGAACWLRQLFAAEREAEAAR